MSDLVRASRNPRQWELDGTPWFVACWWALWLIIGVAGQVAMRLVLRAQTVEALQAATTLDIVRGALSIPLYLLAMQIVARVWRDQSQAARM